jgi:hypothetical protein
MPGPSVFSLATLSLGILPFPSLRSPPSYSAIWDKFVTLLTHKDLDFPKLEHLIVPMCPSTQLFFKLYGHQIKTFDTTSFYSQHVISPILDLCPSVEVLSIDLCNEIPSFPLSLPALREVRIFPCTEDLCGSNQRDFVHSCPLRLYELMEQIYLVDLPEAKRMTINNYGPFRDLDIHHTFMARWRARWTGRGIFFANADGEELGR